MDKNAIKKYAVWARRELIERVAKKALQYGIEEKNILDVNADSIGGKLLSASEKKQRQALIAQINDKGYEQVMEEVAYTWFNRFSALRFMEVNGYLPTHVRVFTDDANNFKPQILAEAIHLEMDGLDMDKVFELKDTNQTDELYKYLLITQCNSLNKILPGMFQKISDYTELLLPDNLLREGSVIEQMITLIEEENWKDAVQIIGWLYQYYNSEKKDEVFAALKKNVKITKENIPAATQLFTPDWIVRYMVENSLGRLWLEGHPNEGLKSNWKYYLDEAEQEADVQAQIDKIRDEYKNIKPEEIKCIDPCTGSGHILAYMFDVLVQIYEAYGYTAREAVNSIVENNIYGLDIDERAAQLARFAVMMKARQYDRRFFAKKDDDGKLAVPQPHIHVICESNHISKECLDYFANGDKNLRREINALVDEMYDAKEYGSILKISLYDFYTMYNRIKEIEQESNINIYTMESLRKLAPLIENAQIIAQKYDVIITNPPYMGSSGMDRKLNDFAKKEYQDTRSDMSTIMMEKSIEMCTQRGYISMINIPSWMFISSYENLRHSILMENMIVNMLHFARGVFGSDFGTTGFVIAKNKIKNYKATYRQLFKTQGTVDTVEEKEKMFFEGNKLFTKNQRDFLQIPGNTIAYWISDNELSIYKSTKLLEKTSPPRTGMMTTNNNLFLRYWHEVDFNKIGLNVASIEESTISKKQWFPYNKGGDFRRWYGNREYVVNWRNQGEDICNAGMTSFRGRDYYFKEGITWSIFGFNNFAARYTPIGSIFDIGGTSTFPDEKLRLYILALLNSKIAFEYISIVNPTVNIQNGDIKRIPLKQNEAMLSVVNQLCSSSIVISKNDWDSFEISWDFKRNPLVNLCDRYSGENGQDHARICDAYLEWEDDCNERFNTLKSNEEELNRVFIDIYGLQKELTPKIEDKDITIRKADLQRDIKALISYAVGCMFGRYSLDIDGLIYAGGEWDATKYQSFAADKDNIIPICDDEYFDDDIVGRFVKFIEVVYGIGALQENLKFIADALGGKGNPKEIIRNYFLNDFYNDHVKMYQKRPIYWQFDSGKKNGFKSLIYMHRYQPDTIMRIRTDYVHEQQSRYRTAISDLEQRINGASTTERVKLTKKLTAIQAQAIEIREYEEKIHHIADQMIRINLDDGVKSNYEIFKDVLAKIK